MLPFRAGKGYVSQESHQETAKRQTPKVRRRRVPFQLKGRRPSLSFVDDTCCALTQRSIVSAVFFFFFLCGTRRLIDTHSLLDALVYLSLLSLSSVFHLPRRRAAAKHHFRPAPRLAAPKRIRHGTRVPSTIHYQVLLAAPSSCSSSLSHLLIFIYSFIHFRVPLPRRRAAAEARHHRSLCLPWYQTITLTAHSHCPAGCC